MTADIVEPKNQVLTIRIPKPEHDALKMFAFHTDKSVNEVVLKAIRDYLSREGRTKEFEKLLDSARNQYRVALDKLKDL